MRQEFSFPEGISGIGSDIPWCGRWQGGKFCQFCRHHTTFDVWSKEWKWYYLLSWHDDIWGGKPGYWSLEQSHYKQVHRNWKTGIHEGKYDIRKYNNTGLNRAEMKALLRKGCRKGVKCKCVSVAQKGHWYCAECYTIIEKLANQSGKHIHDIMITNRDELKAEFLINRLSGII